MSLPADWVRADLHSHTYHSGDSATRPEKIVATCVARGIDVLAVTDHNEIRGAFEVQAKAPFQVIIGEEIRTTEGEIIGYFLNDWIPPRLSPEETIERIHQQGGVAVVPHPLDRLRNSRLTLAALNRVADQLDGLEVYNARIHFSADREKAAAYAAERNLPVTAGSDAHLWWELGNAVVELPRFATSQEFIQSLRSGRLVGHQATPTVHFLTKLTKYRKKIFARRSAVTANRDHLAR